MTAIQPTALMSGRYQRAFTIGVVFLVAGWHLGGAGGQLLHNRPAYGSFAFQGAMWLVMALAITAGSVLVLRGEPGRGPAWALAVIVVAASTASAAASPAGWRSTGRGAAPAGPSCCCSAAGSPSWPRSWPLRP
jgi:hypothetical protein